MSQQGKEKSWEISLKMLGIGVYNESIVFDFEAFDLELNIRVFQLLFVRRVIINYKRVYKSSMFVSQN
jgi:hypothetical protein